MRLKLLPGKIQQIIELPHVRWGSFIRGWLDRQKTGTVPCVIKGSGRIVQVPLRDFYETYGYFSEVSVGRREISFFLDHVMPGDVFYDIGSFRGAYSAAASLKSENRISVHVFEPLAKNVEAIRRICNLNAFTNFNISQMALSDGNTLSARITEDMIRASDAPTTALADFPSTSVDAYIACGNPPPTLIKLDVEGFELRVLRGAEQCLKRYRPRLWVEVHPDFLKVQGCSDEDVLKFLRQANYNITYYTDYFAGTQAAYHIWCH
jgi:FkbM family methyltransferase